MLLIRGSVVSAFASRQTNNPGAGNGGEYGLGAPPADMPMCGQGASWGGATTSKASEDDVANAASAVTAFGARARARP